MYNTSQLQPLRSKRCGWYVRKWLISMLRTENMYRALYEGFTQNPTAANDKYVVSDRDGNKTNK